MRCKQKVLALLLAMSSTALAVDPGCKIGETPYNTLQEAVNKAVKLDAETTTTMIAIINENVETPKDVTITLDLNGCTLDGGTTPSKPALMNNGTVTIQDSGSGGTIKRPDNGVRGRRIEGCAGFFDGGFDNLGKVWTNAAPCANINRFSQGKEGVAAGPRPTPCGRDGSRGREGRQNAAKKLFFFMFSSFSHAILKDSGTSTPAPTRYRPGNQIVKHKGIRP